MDCESGTTFQLVLVDEEGDRLATREPDVARHTSLRRAPVRRWRGQHSHCLYTCTRTCIHVYMSLYVIPRSCGHTEEVQIQGTDVRGERDRRAARAAERPCAACLDEAREAESAQHARQAAEMGLPPLTGTDRQVRWAQTLRIQGVDQVAQLRAEVATFVAQHPDRAGEAAELDRALDASIHRQTAAAWWIEHRDDLRRALHRDALTNPATEQDQP